MTTAVVLWISNPQYGSPFCLVNPLDEKVPPWSAVRFRLMRGGLCLFKYSIDGLVVKKKQLQTTLIKCLLKIEPE